LFTHEALSAPLVKKLGSFFALFLALATAGLFLFFCEIGYFIKATFEHKEAAPE